MLIQRRARHGLEALQLNRGARIVALNAHEKVDDDEEDDDKPRGGDGHDDDRADEARQDGEQVFALRECGSWVTSMKTGWVRKKIC